MIGDPRKIDLIMKFRNQGIRNVRVLEAIEKVPREMFVPPSYALEAYADHALPIECGQTISQPFIVAFMTDRLKVGKRMKVLEVGTGSGYQTAILAMLSRRVYTIERHRQLLGDALDRLETLKLGNVTSMVGDGSKGWPAQAPFERIIVTAAAREVPAPLLEQLAVDGLMVIPVETPENRQELKRITRRTSGYETESLLNVRFVPLVEGAAPP
ncbi:MAG TPA: protein-L-isoaspartate(D-aspartate) O-methyltransferase [Aestuariivirgaceae bacterium]|nr:protein-L-isoaspartate(D-aspartate) O-methyltransferase [Aestuariivirgaceae bacterium]